MSQFLNSAENDLGDMWRGRPELVEAMGGRATGLRLLSLVGTGGMSTVFLAELNAEKRSVDLAETTPQQVAVKFLQPSTWRQFERLNQDPSQVFLREVVALSRIMDRTPKTDFVVGFYGSGYADVKTTQAVLRLPWIAIEYVSGSGAGVSLAERVARAAPQGIDAVRALRLLRGIFAGVAVLHEEGILHRDLKPENVLVAGPVDDETPKLADCGIARVDGIMATVAGMTPSYGGPEQALSAHGRRNPLIGPWTDIHALAAVVWYVLTGEDWCRTDTDPAWHSGARRSLRTALRVSAVLDSAGSLLDRIDAVLARGGAPRLPDAAWQLPGAAEYARVVEKVAPNMLLGPQRYENVETFARELFPLLEEYATAWTTRAAQENRAGTALRPTQPIEEPPSAPISATIREIAPQPTGEATVGALVFQSDGRFLMRFGDRLEYFIDDKAHRVKVPPDCRDAVATSKWMARGPGGGFALVGPSRVLLVRGGQFVTMPMPARPDGGEVGPIVAVLDDGRVFGVVTEETDDGDGGPELWRSADGTKWDEPTVLPLGGDVSAIAFGPYGFIVVGARKKKARAMFLGFDNHPLLFVKGVSDHTPLVACVCSAGRDNWAAGSGYVLYLERGSVHEESIEVTDRPIAMGLDIVGVPWLLTESHVLRRHVGSRSAYWRVYHRRTSADLPFIGFGLSRHGVRVVDTRGGGVHIAPRDFPK